MEHGVHGAADPAMTPFSVADRSDRGWPPRSAAGGRRAYCQCVRERPEIAGHGGGTVEGYPEETDDRTLSGSFLHTGPMAAFENHGFARARLISPHRWVVTRTVDPV